MNNNVEGARDVKAERVGCCEEVAHLCGFVFVLWYENGWDSGRINGWNGEKRGIRDLYSK